MFKTFMVTLFCLLVCRPAGAADKIVLMLNWYVFGEHAPFYYGKEKGLYADEGIDLEIQEGRGSATVTQVVAAKSVQFGYVDVPTMIRAASKGAPVIAVGVALQTTPFAAMGFADRNIRKPEDIRGKTVITGPGDSLTQIFPLFLKKTGLKDSEFTTLSGDSNMKLNSVINGQADLLLGAVMDQSMKIKDATGKDVYAIKWADYGVHLVSSGVIVNKDLVRQQPDLIRRFMSASTKAIEQASQRPREAAQAILNAVPKGGKLETLQEGFGLTIPLYADQTGAATRPLRVSEQSMNETVEVMIEYGLLDEKAKGHAGDFYTNDYLPKTQ